MHRSYLLAFSLGVKNYCLAEKGDTLSQSGIVRMKELIYLLISLLLIECIKARSYSTLALIFLVNELRSKESLISSANCAMRDRTPLTAQGCRQIATYSDCLLLHITIRKRVVLSESKC